MENLPYCMDGPPTTRRSLLGAISAVAISGGCLGQGAEASRTLATVEHIDTQTRKFAISVSVERSKITTNETALARFTVRNPTDDELVLENIYENDASIITSLKPPDSDNNLGLVPIGSHKRRKSHARNCWRTKSDDFGGFAGTRGYALPPESSVTQEFAFWNGFESRCFPSGEYTFGDNELKEQNDWQVTFLVTNKTGQE